jgi:hypothetical protein
VGEEVRPGALVTDEAIIQLYVVRNLHINTKQFTFDCSDQLGQQSLL